jgi:type VI secretion system Hcp family effector
MHYNRVFFMLLAGLMLSSIGPAVAQYHMYMTITGEKQGEIKGSSTKKGRKDWIPIVYLGKLSIDDIRSGSPKRPHHPIVVTKQEDASSPQLFQACTNGEILKDVVIECTKMVGNKETVFKTVHLTDGLITYSTKDPVHHTEELQFNYTAIEVKNMDPSVSTTDDVTAQSL